MKLGNTPPHGLKIAPRTPTNPSVTRPGSAGVGCSPTTQSMQAVVKAPSIRDRTPIYAMAFVNCAASYWGAVGVQAAAESVFPLMSDLPVLQHMFTSEVSKAFNWTGIWDRFVDTMVFGMACTPFYGGISVFNFVPAKQDQQWVRERAPRLTSALTSGWQGVRSRVSGAFNRTFAKRMPRFHQYFGRFADKGVVGIIGMLRERDSADIGWLKKTQQWLGSKPLTRAATAIGQMFGKTMLAAKRAHADDAAALDGAVARATQVANLGAALCAKPEALMSFLSSVLPTERAKFTGLSTELTVSTGIGGIEAVLFGSPWHFNTFAQSGVINGLTGFANVAVSQHDGFDQQAVWWERTKIGILKGAVYRGICTTRTVAPWFGYVLQGAYGLAAMAYANHITGASEAQRAEQADAREHRAEQIEASLRAYLEGSTS